MGEVEVREERRVHVVVVPYPTQGHINPLLQFAKHLAHRQLKLTLLLISSNNSHNDSTHLPLTLAHRSLLPYHGTDPETIESFWDRRHASIRWYLTELLARHESHCDPIACVVYDSIMPWILDITKQFGVPGASFFTQSSTVNAIYYNVNKGLLNNVPLQQRTVSFDGFPVLHSSDLPSFVSDRGKCPAILNFLSDQFTRLDEADWIFANTFDTLEQEEIKWMESHVLPFKNIGPMVPSIYLDGQLPNDRDYGLSLFESNSNSTMKWLDSRANNSVVYVAFGSSAELGKDQMEEVAWGLKLSNRFFLWVVRESEIHKLPPSFIDETSEKGLVVRWCPQLEVLAHDSVGCFVTHCGWNSTLEALSLGVPLVAMAQCSDQPTNAKYVEDVWKVGKRVRVGEDGICRREQIEECVSEVIEENYGKEIKENMRKWRELAKAAMDEGGSSSTNINHFVLQLLRKTQL